ncbi:hypothetical protein KC345_g223 [Hortaea werneckii]|nr:hypothetical protein KC345_g223 [Hortaea werneckii]
MAVGRAPCRLLRCIYQTKAHAKRRTGERAINASQRGNVCKGLSRSILRRYIRAREQAMSLSSRRLTLPSTWLSVPTKKWTRNMSLSASKCQFVRHLCRSPGGQNFSFSLSYCSV